MPTVSARKISRLQCGGYSRAAKSTSRITGDPQGPRPGSGSERKKSSPARVVRFPAEPNAATRKRAGVQACSPAGGIRGWPPRSCTVVSRSCTGAVRKAARYRKRENRDHPRPCGPVAELAPYTLTTTRCRSLRARLTQNQPIHTPQPSGDGTAFPLRFVNNHQIGATTSLPANPG